jgi:hypothetical protein
MHSTVYLSESYRSFYGLYRVSRRELTGACMDSTVCLAELTELLCTLQCICQGVNRAFTGSAMCVSER